MRYCVRDCALLCRTVDVVLHHDRRSLPHWPVVRCCVYLLRWLSRAAYTTKDVDGVRCQLVNGTSLLEHMTQCGGASDSPRRCHVTGSKAANKLCAPGSGGVVGHLVNTAKDTRTHTHTERQTQTGACTRARDNKRRPPQLRRSETEHRQQTPTNQANHRTMAEPPGKPHKHRTRLNQTNDHDNRVQLTAP